MADIFPINGWNGRARVQCAPCQLTERATQKQLDDAEFRRWVLTLIEARDLPAHELRFISGEMSTLAFAKEREPEGVA